MNKQKKKLLTGFITAVFCITSVAPAFAANPQETTASPINKEPVLEEMVPDNTTTAQKATTEESIKDFKIKYQSPAGTFSKISHPDKGTSSRNGEKIPDGIVDYLGNSQVGVPGVDAGADGQGARGQNYSWASVAYGDWMYVSTCYSAMMNTIGLMGEDGLGHNMTMPEMKKTLDKLYGGDFFVAEEDNGRPGGLLCKINVKTGEIRILKRNVLFRNAVIYKDNIYFCGSDRGLPCVYRVNPKDDNDVTRVYYDESVDPTQLKKLIQEKKICPAIRGITTFKDTLVISCVGIDANPYIAITKADKPGQKDFKVIANSYKKGSNNTEKGELLGYPACKLQDAIYGGSIWEMVEFNGKLYVALCTGKGDPKDPTNTPDKLQSFAIMRGTCNGDPTKANAWNWEPLIGDPEDGSRYPFGIDPERTRAAACNMTVHDNHLYIGEYNDTEIALIDVLFHKDAKFLANNLKQSVSIYRMDKNENIEKVMGDPTTKYPTSLSGINKSGFGKHSNQYIWQMRSFEGKLYVGTLDEGSLLYPLSRISNGEIVGFSENEWAQKTNKAMQAMENVVESPSSSDKAVGKQELDIMQQMLSAEKQLVSANTTVAPNLGKYVPKQGNENFSKDILTTDRTMAVKDLTDLPEALYTAQGLLEQDADWTLEERLVSMMEFNRVYAKSLDVYQKNRKQLPVEVTGSLDHLLTLENLKKMEGFAECLFLLHGTECGFDMYVSGNGATFTPITTNGMGDPYNHGLRVFATNYDPDNSWLAIGTANPFYGTQVWRLDNENVLPKPEKPEKPGEDQNKPNEDGEVPPDEKPDDSDDSKVPVDPDPDGDGFIDNPDDVTPKDKVVMTIGSKTIVVNNLQKSIDCAPLIKQSRTYVPFRALAEAFGAEVDYYNDSQTIITELDGTRVTMKIGSRNYTVNGKSYRMDVSPFITNSRTMVPIRFVAEAFGIEVTPVYNNDGTTANVLFSR